MKSVEELRLYFRLNQEANNEPATPFPIRNFALNEKELEHSFGKLGDKFSASPSRMLSDLFWINIDWQKTKEALGEINILDLGCGKGGYLKKIFHWSNKLISSYNGIDLQEFPEWKNFTNDKNYKNIDTSFTKLNVDENINNLKSFFPDKINFFMSQSALEHIKYDLEIFRQIKEYIVENGKPVTQVHLVPAPESLRLYLAHGYRQYGQKALSSIINIFKDFCEVKIFGLCGKNCNDLHFEYITEPIYYLNTPDKRETHPNEYEKELKKSIAEDMKTHPVNSACFWALEINYKGKQ